MNCPDCETPLAYPEKCPCGWVWRAQLDPIEVRKTEAEKVKEQITLQAKKDAAIWAEHSGQGQREYEPGRIQHWQREGLAALKRMLRRV